MELLAPRVGFEFRAEELKLKLKLKIQVSRAPCPVPVPVSVPCGIGSRAAVLPAPAFPGLRINGDRAGSTYRFLLLFYQGDAFVLSAHINAIYVL